MNEIRATLENLYRTPGPWTSVYLDASGAGPDPRGFAMSKRNSISHRLEQAGAPRADIDAVVEALVDPTGVPAPVARLLLVKDGEVRLDEALPGPVQVAEFAEHGQIPDLVPVLRHHPVDFEYLVVQVGHDAGDITLCTTADARPAGQEHVQGRADTLQKVRGNGWSDANYDRHVVDVWTHNEGEVAQRVDALVVEHNPRFVLAAGEEVGLAIFTDRLSEASRKVLRTVVVDARPSDASDQRLREAIDRAVAGELEALRAQALDGLRERTAGEAAREALGVGEVVHALQQGQVDTLLLLDANGAADRAPELDERTVLALDAEPWVATAPEEAASAQVLEKVPAPSGLVRAAVLTGATVLFAPPEELPPHVGAAASLRWSAQAS
ncbi:baeRF2 domain-containing protein [Gryllotalpicola ginsengisoli]|uniref:baeRF2 domain-containing protein n=1 Tax=Gryllotalpicola ginsengisoli TaxID=444608 RepID=UPI0003B6ED8C|nr:Vms1/Ankzf1 family peptidyl-tRNA hydrolase [Gryllotalpicola ginsengisoli]